MTHHLGAVNRSQCREVSKRSVQRVNVAAVIRVTELVVLPRVDEFVAHGRTEVLPPVLFIGLPDQRDRI